MERENLELSSNEKVGGRKILVEIEKREEEKWVKVGHEIHACKR